MEWIRTIVSSDSGFGFNNQHYGHTDHPSSSSAERGRGLPPPPRSRGISPLPSLTSDTSSPVSGPAAPTAEGSHRIRQSAFPDLHPESLSPAPPVYEPRSNPNGPEHENDQDLPLAAPPGGLAGTRQLYPSSSLRKKRQHKGLPVPDLELNEDATSPSLWIDDETLDRFGRSVQVSPASKSRVPLPLPPQTRTGDTTGSSRPPADLLVPHVPIALLNINERTIFPTSIPPMRNTKPATLPAAAGPSGPSAFNAPELMSRFSPDSSRASFSTLQHETRRRGSETSVKELPPPPPPPLPLVPAPTSAHTPVQVADTAPTGPNQGMYTNSTPRIGGDQHTRRYDRSAVTPQLPTLATSNADAFRAEMVEWSASTGSSDRMERVISFHGNRD